MRRLPYPQKNRRILRRFRRIRIEPEYCDECMAAFQEQVDNERPGHVWTIQNGHVVYMEDVVAEHHLGRKLTENEVVIHRNQDVFDNRLENLEVVTIPELGGV